MATEVDPSEQPLQAAAPDYSMTLAGGTPVPTVDELDTGGNMTRFLESLLIGRTEQERRSGPMTAPAATEGGSAPIDVQARILTATNIFNMSTAASRTSTRAPNPPAPLTASDLAQSQYGIAHSLSHIAAGTCALSL